MGKDVAPAPGADASDVEQRYWQHPLWSLFLGFEHERIHLETSSVLMRELPLEWMRKPEEWRGYHESATVVRDASNMHDAAHEMCGLWAQTATSPCIDTSHVLSVAPGSSASRIMSVLHQAASCS